MLEWIVISSSRASSRPRDGTHVSCIAGEFFTAEPPGKPPGQPFLPQNALAACNSDAVIQSWAGILDLLLVKSSLSDSCLISWSIQFPYLLKEKTLGLMQVLTNTD